MQPANKRVQPTLGNTRAADAWGWAFKMKSVTTFAVLVVLSVLLPIKAVLACDCAPTKGSLEVGVRAGFDEASAVFSAEVVEVEDFQAGFEHFQATTVRERRH
jgi:hypothetical protein